MLRPWTLILLGAVPVFLCGTNAILNRFSRIHPHRTPFTAGFYTNLVFLPLYAILHFSRVSASEFASGVIVLVIYLNCLVFLNWFIFTLTDVSMHIQLLMQLHRRGTMTVPELQASYNKNVILGNRIPRLLELGQLRLENGRLFVAGGSVLLAASVVALLRRILGIPVRPELAEHGNS